MGEDTYYVLVRSKKKPKNRSRSATKPQPIVISVKAGYRDTKPGGAANRMDDPVPSMEIMRKSACDHDSVRDKFKTIATSTKTSDNDDLTWQGDEALELIGPDHIDIASIKKEATLPLQGTLAENAYEMIQRRLGETREDPCCQHWFFLYHPDDDWHSAFYDLFAKEPLDRRFCGYTNHIDTAFAFMLAARCRLIHKERNAQKREKKPQSVQFHLLIPACQHMLIDEELAVPEAIGDFLIEATEHKRNKLVWINLPENQRHYAPSTGHWEPPAQGFWNWIVVQIGVAEPPPRRRVLGLGQQEKESSDESSGPSSESEAVESSDARTGDAGTGEESAGDRSVGEESDGADDSPRRGGHDRIPQQQHKRHRRRLRSHDERRGRRNHRESKVSQSRSRGRQVRRRPRRAVSSLR